MHAGIGPPGSQDGAPLPAKLGQGGFDDRLYGTLLPLALEAGKSPAIV
jgi:hypothetical protein